VFKAALTVSSLAMFATFYLGYIAAMGWPVAAALPEKFKFLAAEVHEPDADVGDQGYILLWARPTDERDPRAYRLPYSRSLHEQMEEARQRGQHGMPVYMMRKGRKGGTLYPNLRPDTHFDNQEKLDFIPPPSTAPPKEG
jgi:hypothetical protein